MGYYNHSAQTPGQRHRTSCQTREVGLREPRHAFLHSVYTFSLSSVKWALIFFVSKTSPRKKKIDLLKQGGILKIRKLEEWSFETNEQSNF